MRLPVSVRSIVARVPGARPLYRVVRRLLRAPPPVTVVAAPPSPGSWRPAGHFYSPLPSPAEVHRDADRIWPVPAPRELAGIDLRLDHQVAVLRQLAAVHDELPAYGPKPLAGFRFRTENNMYGLADAAQLMAFMRLRHPKRIIEVGSGFSSATILDTVEHFLADRPELTFIEPYPDRLDALLRDEDRARCDVLVQRVQDVPLERFSRLEDGDILVIDSSHVSKTGSDVNHLYFEVLPRLAPGVLVHVHDVGFPFEYPRTWVDEGRAWNEAYLLRAFLTFNTDFQIELWNGALRALRPAAFEGIPNLRGGSQIWIRRATASELPAGTASDATRSAAEGAADAD